MKFYVRYFAGEFLLLMKGKIFRPGHFSESVGILVEQQVRGGRLLRGEETSIRAFRKYEPHSRRSQGWLLPLCRYLESERHSLQTQNSPSFS